MSEHSNCDNCNKIVHQLLELEAEISIMPHITHADPKIYCLKSNILPCRDSNKDKKNKKNPEPDAKKCCFTVTQVICVEIPISFDVDVDVDEGIAHCCKPGLGPCKPSDPKSLPKSPETCKLKEAANSSNSLTLTSIRNFLKRINPEKLRSFLTKDILKTSLYHAEIFRNIMQYKIREVCILWQIPTNAKIPDLNRLLRQI